MEDNNEKKNVDLKIKEGVKENIVTNHGDKSQKDKAGFVPQKRRQTQQKRWRGPGAAQEDSGFVEKVIKINRVSKSTKGGKNMSFSALVVVGDAKGHAGFSLGKANDVASAIRKALADAKKNMLKVPMRGSTITHEVIGSCGAAKVLLKPASDGTGVIASGPVRAVCDAAGIRNILTKCHRSNNPLNVVKATIEGFSRLKSDIESLSVSETQEQVNAAS